MSHSVPPHNANDSNTCGDVTVPLARHLPNSSKTDHELDRVNDAWPLLTADDRSAVLAIVDAALGRAAR
jgi:hypothetical protein